MPPLFNQLKLMTAQVYWLEYAKKNRCPRKRLMLATVIVLLSISEVHHATLIIKEREKENVRQFFKSSSALLAIPEDDGYAHKVRIWKYILLNSKKPIDSTEALVIAACCVDTGFRRAVSPYLIASVLRAESGFVDNVVNSKNCFGLAQIRPFDNVGKDVWFNELKREGIIENETDLLNYTNNIEACGYILAKYRTLYKTLFSVLSRYNGCESNQVYVGDVISNLEKFEELAI